MQFAAMVESDVSTARALFSFKSTNVEEWGLYPERIVQPFMPADGQLISLQNRLMRAARAFLDPELQSGNVTPDFILSQGLLPPALMRQTVVERFQKP
jgi:hypothetical protein